MNDQIEEVALQTASDNLLRLTDSELRERLDSISDHPLARICDVSEDYTQQNALKTKYTVLSTVNKIIMDYYRELPLEQAVILIELSDRIDTLFYGEVE